MIKVLGLCTAIAFAMPGCAAFAGAVPVIQDVLLYASDAQAILSAIQTIANTFFVNHQNAELQNKVLNALADTQLALDMVIQTSHGVQNVDESRLQAALVNFATAYGDLMLLLQQAGIADGSGGLRATKDGPMVRKVPTPLLMTKMLHKK